MTVVVWHHLDLRVEDHPALTEACTLGLPLIPLYIYDSKRYRDWAPGEASRWWLHESLGDLSKRYRELGSGLVVRSGDTRQELFKLITEHRVTHIFWIERTEPAFLESDQQLLKELEAKGVKVQITSGNYLADPDQLRNKSGGPYRVFTPYYKAMCQEVGVEKPLPAPELPSLPQVRIGDLDSLGLLPSNQWYMKLAKHWTPGREGALKRLRMFDDGSYHKRRDLPFDDGTSKLSPHLHFGEISPREVWHGCQGAEPFRRQIVWREFGWNFLHHWPQVQDTSWKEEFERFPWKFDDALMEAWSKGKTGYPIVDAGMRELWETGWMHNRVRMITASFLIKDLLIHWVEGAKWFWDTLVDADLGNNTLGWQWVAGCGPDAAPYFRIFNPTLQGKKFDPDGVYIKRYLPELANCPVSSIHTPWEAGYDLPVVDHSECRDAALAGYAKIK